MEIYKTIAITILQIQEGIHQANESLRDHRVVMPDPIEFDLSLDNNSDSPNRIRFTVPIDRNYKKIKPCS